MFFPFIGISAAALALVNLGSLAVTVLYLKALLAFAVAIGAAGSGADHASPQRH